MNNKITSLILLFFIVYSYAQEKKKDTIVLNEVIVTATKTKRQLSNVTVPVTLIKQKEIEQLNVIKVQDVLNEYTGLDIVTSPLGSGIQMQGLDPSYSLILIDGQPLTGRLDGTLDLSRLSSENIAQIEIVNGPSSVLYGSEALAGVVNIITKKAKKNSLSINSKLSSFDTYNISSRGSLVGKKMKASLFSNYYTTQGYNITSSYRGVNLTDEYYGKTVSPHQNFTIGSNLKFDINKKIDLNLNVRFFDEKQQYNFIESVNDLFISGNGNIKDHNITSNFNYKFNDKLLSKIKVYHTSYKSNIIEKEENNVIYKESFFNEKFTNIELQNDYKFNKKHTVTLGLGYAQEGVGTSILFSNSDFKANNNYAFLQYILDFNDKLNIVAGARFDKHDSFTNQFNPKLAAKYKVSDNLSIRASFGTGFKKPTFKELYYNLNNPAVGYTVLGTTFVEQGINDLLNQNEIVINPTTNEPEIYSLYQTIVNNDGVINPETSVGLNLGFDYSGITNTKIKLNIFRNDLKNLIEATPIALKTNGQFVYSYQNISRVFTQGATLDITYKLSNNIKISGGYQYTIAKDKAVVDRLNNEGIFAQDPVTLSSYRISKKDYGGLLNRSKHTANIKFLANDIYKGIAFNTRVLFKSKFGFADLNNNQILDIAKEYTDDYVLVNAAVSKLFLEKKLRLQVGINNLLDYTYSTENYTISSLPGRIFFTTINYKF